MPCSCVSMSRTGATVAVMTPAMMFGCVLAVSLGAMSSTVLGDDAKVALIRTPNEGLQPQVAIDSTGILHLIYFKGKPAAGDVFHVQRSAANGPSAGFSTPVRVNSQPNSAIAIGTIRGAHLALGKGDRVHVAWNGSGESLPASAPRNQTPMLYTRLADDGAQFEPQRNVIDSNYGLDGGGSVAADASGNVYVAWHAGTGTGEANRKVWVAKSTDEGKTFQKEALATSQRTGACGCCGMKATTDSAGNVYMLFRGARDDTNRDMLLLVSQNSGKSFSTTSLDRWQIAKCPMSSEAFAVTSDGVIGAWENDGQIFFTRINVKTGKPGRPMSPPGGARERKHPTLAVNEKGEILLAWAEGTGWQKGGHLAWQVFDKTGKPTKERGRIDNGVPVWSVPAAIALPDNSFTLIH